MLLTITTTHAPATDLGFLLCKNPARLQEFKLNFGRAYVFYPEATDDRCTAALLLDVDPVGLVRNSRGPAGEGFALRQYVNDRPYSATSFMSVAIAEVFGSALSGRSRERPELVETKLPLEAHLPVLPCRVGEGWLRRLFEPLGYEIQTARHPLDPHFPEWGESSYFALTLHGHATLHDLLTHLYVLIPVLDGDKHYWIGSDEVDKLLRHGQGWLSTHPEKDQIVDRYLKRRKHLTRAALAQLLEKDDRPDDTEADVAQPIETEERVSLHEQRHGAVIAALRACGAKRVLDLGCSSGALLRRLLAEPQFSEIVGMDVSHRSLAIASDRLNLDRLPPKQRERIRLIQGSLIYRDERLHGYDAAAVVEVIEHLDPPRLAAFERVLFEFARPRVAIVTTPNIEYNVLFESLAAGAVRHADHRFEWTRKEFADWCSRISERFNYRFRLLPVGPEDPAHGPPTQMAIFETEA